MTRNGSGDLRAVIVRQMRDAQIVPDETRLPSREEIVDQILALPEAQALLGAAATVHAIRRIHVPAHSFCIVCDAGRDVEHLGNNPTCVHYPSFCRNCDYEWPCPTEEAIREGE